MAGVHAVSCEGVHTPATPAYQPRNSRSGVNKLLTWGGNSVRLL